MAGRRVFQGNGDSATESFARHFEHCPVTRGRYDSGDGVSMEL